MPVLLRPKADYSADAILVGDPGRALLLAQELLEQPRMCNHARGLWGYSGETPEGAELTIQSTGVGAPSAVAVLADLAELGVRRAVRVGTCTGLGDRARPGELLIVTEAIAAAGSASVFGVAAGEAVAADAGLGERLRLGLDGDARAVRIVSLDTVPAARDVPPAGSVAADMQTLAVLAQGRRLGIAVAALLAVVEAPAGTTIAEEELERISKRAGRAAATALSP
jgi:uridine phosphorylase